MDKKKIHGYLYIGSLMILLFWAINHTSQFMEVIAGVFQVFFPFLLGGAIAFILNVPMRAVEKHLFRRDTSNKYSHLKRTCAFLITFFGVIAFITIVMFVIVPEVVNAIKQLVNQVPIATDRFLAWLSTMGKQYPDLVNEVTDYIQNMEIDWQDIFGERVPNLLSTGIAAVSGVVSGLVTFFVSMVFSVYLLFQKENLKRQFKKLIYRIFCKKRADRIKYLINLTSTTFANFLQGQCLEAVILGSMFCIVMLILQLPYAFLIGVLISVTALVPIVGAFVGCAIGALFIAMVNPMQALVFIVLFLILQQVEGNLIYPHVVGNSIGLPGIWVLVAVTIGGNLFGVIGMLLFIPLCSVCYVLLKVYVNTGNKEDKNESKQSVQDESKQSIQDESRKKI